MFPERYFALHGSYYGRNYGDTLILRIVANWMQEENVNVVLPFVDSNLEKREITGDSTQFPGFSNIAGLIYGPGGYFGEPPGSLKHRLRWSIRCFRRHLIWHNQLIKNDIPYMMVGMGVGPISNLLIRRKIVHIFKGAQYISVRDDVSKSYLVRWGVDADRIDVFPDVATTLKRKSEKFEEEKIRIGVHLPGCDKLKNAHILYEFIKGLCDKHQVYIIEDGEHQTQNRGQGLLKSLDGYSFELLSYEGPDRLTKALEGMSLVFTTKLHVGIVSYALNVPVISIPLHTKTKRFYEQINRQKYCIDPDLISTSVLSELFEEALVTRNVTNELLESADENRLLVKEFIRKVSFK